MRTLFEGSFGHDLKKIKDKRILKQVREVIEQVEASASLNNVANVRKIQGFDTYYRIRVGNYRIGIEVSEGRVIFVRCLNRKDIYRYFP